MTRGIPWWAAALAGLVLTSSVRSGTAVAYERQFPAPPRRPSNTQTADSGLTVVIKSQHRRLTFTQDIQRVAVGDTDILSAELITSREVLALGRETGRTTLVVWFVNGSSREYLFS